MHSLSDFRPLSAMSPRCSRPQQQQLHGLNTQHMLRTSLGNSTVCILQVFTSTPPPRSDDPVMGDIRHHIVRHIVYMPRGSRSTRPGYCNHYKHLDILPMKKRRNRRLQTAREGSQDLTTCGSTPRAISQCICNRPADDSRDSAKKGLGTCSNGTSLLEGYHRGPRLGYKTDRCNVSWENQIYKAL